MSDDRSSRADSGDIAPPPYENTAKSALSVVGWTAFVLGVVVSGASGSMLSNASDDYEPVSLGTLTSFGVGVLLVVIGIVFLAAYLVTRSTTYDLLYRFGPHPDHPQQTDGRPTLTEAEIAARYRQTGITTPAAQPGER